MISANSRQVARQLDRSVMFYRGEPVHEATHELQTPSARPNTPSPELLRSAAHSGGSTRHCSGPIRLRISPPLRHRLPARIRRDETPTPPGHRFRRRTSPARRTGRISPDRQSAGRGDQPPLIGAMVFMRPPSDGGSSIYRAVGGSAMVRSGSRCTRPVGGPGRPSRGRPVGVDVPRPSKGKIRALRRLVLNFTGAANVAAGSGSTRRMVLARVRPELRAL